MKKHFITGLVDLADETRKRMVGKEEGDGGVNPPVTPTKKHRSTIDSPPKSKDPPQVRSQVGVSDAEPHVDNPDEEEAHRFIRKPSQLPLLPNMGEFRGDDFIFFV